MIQTHIHTNAGRASNKASPHQKVEDHVELHAEIAASSWAAVLSEGARVACCWDFSSSESVDELIISGPGGALKMAGMSPSLPIFVLGPTGEVIEEIWFEAPEHVAQPLIQQITHHLVARHYRTKRCRQQVMARKRFEGRTARNGAGSSAGNEKGGRGGGMAPSGADNALRTAAVLDKVLDSYYGGRSDEFWARPDSWPGLAAAGAGRG